MSTKVSRRAFLACTAPLLVGSRLVPAASAAPFQEPRLLVVNLRGALDGLAAIAPVGDPALEALRASFGSTQKLGLPLDSFFRLNSNLTALHELYTAKEALFFHAVATPYRSRSHFDAQIVLESGQPAIGGDGTGWLNRALAATSTRSGEWSKDASALAVSPTVPLILRGPAPVENWQPQALQPVDLDLAARLLTVYEARDPRLALALRRGVGIDAFLAEQAPVGKPPRVASSDRFVTTMEAVGKLMAKDDGPRIAAMTIDGWDTHASQGTDNGRLAKQFRALDGGIAALKANMGPLWPNTTVVIVTEFGRTARVNGTGGTDHGTGGIAMLIGGRVNGGRVIADWPGLSEPELLDGRDLKPTTDLRAMLKGVLAGVLGLEDAVLARTIFPESQAIKPMGDLLRA